MATVNLTSEQLKLGVGEWHIPQQGRKLEHHKFYHLWSSPCPSPSAEKLLTVPTVCTGQVVQGKAVRLTLGLTLKSRYLVDV